MSGAVCAIFTLQVKDVRRANEHLNYHLDRGYACCRCAFEGGTRAAVQRHIETSLRCRNGSIEDLRDRVPPNFSDLRNFLFARGIGGVVEEGGDSCKGPRLSAGHREEEGPSCNKTEAPASAGGKKAAAVRLVDGARQAAQSDRCALCGVRSRQRPVRHVFQCRYKPSTLAHRFTCPMCKFRSNASTRIGAHCFKVHACFFRVHTLTQIKDDTRVGFHFIAAFRDGRGFDQAAGQGVRRESRLCRRLPPLFPLHSAADTAGRPSDRRRTRAASIELYLRIDLLPENSNLLVRTTYIVDSMVLSVSYVGPRD